jgi:hypothetical protein
MWHGVRIAAVLSASAGAGCWGMASLEVHVVESETGAPIPGMLTAVGCATKSAPLTPYTDENGRVRLAVTPGTCEVSLPDVGDQSRRRVEVRRRQAAIVELRVDRATHMRAVQGDPSPRCPHSPPGAVIRGHSLPQGVLDDIAHDVLAAWLDDREYRSHDPVRRTILVDIHVEAPGRELTERAVPRTSRTRVYALTRAQIQSIADRAEDTIDYLWFEDIESDGSCAMVELLDSEAPPTGSHYVDIDSNIVDCGLYEKHDGHWQYVPRSREVCR